MSTETLEFRGNKIPFKRVTFDDGHSILSLDISAINLLSIDTFVAFTNEYAKRLVRFDGDSSTMEWEGIDNWLESGDGIALTAEPQPAKPKLVKSTRCVKVTAQQVTYCNVVLRVPADMSDTDILIYAGDMDGGDFVADTGYNSGYWVAPTEVYEVQQGDADKYGLVEIEGV